MQALTEGALGGSDPGMLIGIAGLNSSGKGEVVAYLAERRFVALSLSDVIRRELAGKGLEETRERMIEAGNALRGAGGPGALADRLVSQLLPEHNYVIDSIRHPAEVEALRKSGRPFLLVWIEAEAATRFERMALRDRPGDPDTLESMLALEARELGSADPSAQQLLAVSELADRRLNNDGTLDALHAVVQSMLEGEPSFARPE